jgi:hypothetical protein
MNNREFSKTCREIWGYGWQTKAAIALGIARETVRNYSSGIHRNGNLATIKTEIANKLRGVYEQRSK